jgi:hypothetical protein
MADDIVTPPDVAWSASACGRESGRRDRAFDGTDAERVDRGNAAWLQMAQQFGLFDSDGSFLVSVATGAGDELLPQWFQAKLMDNWDLIGTGAREGVLGFGWSVPAFVMHSVDGNVLIAASTYETSFSVFVVPHPMESSVLRRSAEEWLKRSDWPSDRQSSARRWLAKDDE